MLSLSLAMLDTPAMQGRVVKAVSALLANRTHLPLPFLLLLLDRGADANHVNLDGQTALIETCGAVWLHKKTIEALLAAGADAGIGVLPANLDGRPRGMQRRVIGVTPLMEFARDSNNKVTTLHDRAALVASLIDAGARVDATDSKGLSALHHAAERRNFEMIHVLLDQGANPTLRDANGQCALDVWDPRKNDKSRIEISQALDRLRSAMEREEIAASAAPADPSQDSSPKRL